MLEAGGGGAPIAVHFDEELEEDLFLEEVLYVFAGLGADTLEGRAGLADKDAFLAVAFAVNYRAYMHDAAFVLEGLHFDFDGVWDFLVVIEKDLLADDLVDKESFGLVRQLVLGKESRSFGQGVLDGIEELGHAELLLRGDREDLGFGELGMPELDESFEGVLGREVDLIYYKEHARTFAFGNSRGLGAALRHRNALCLRSPHRVHSVSARCGPRFFTNPFYFLEEVGIAVGVVLDLGDIEEHVGIDER